MVQETNNKTNTIKVLLTITIATIITVIIPILIINSLTSNTRKTTTNDFYIDLSQSISLNMEYKLKPNKKIDNLELAFQFYNNSNKIVTTKTKQIGNVNKDIEYSINISLFEFSLDEIFNITYVRVNVINGTTYIKE